MLSSAWEDLPDESCRVFVGIAADAGDGRPAALDFIALLDECSGDLGAVRC